MTTDKAGKKDRYKLLRLSQSALGANEKFERFQKCCRTPITGDNIMLCASESQKSGFYNGVMACGSPWVCPVCGARISACRCEEIRTAIENHIATGGRVMMGTFTCQHSTKDFLTELLDKQSNAFTRFWRSGSVKKPLAKFGYIGKISAVEVTVSKVNGWHPHRHILLFISKDITKEELKELERKLKKAWVWALKKAELQGTHEIAFKLDLMGNNPEYIAEYVNKFSMEVALNQCKKGRRTFDGKLTDHYSPFGLLYIPEESEDYFWGRSRFNEYAECFKGRKQLFWSRGLKQRLGVQVISDQEILAEPHDAEFLVEIPKDDFKKIPDDYKVDLLRLCEYPRPQRIDALRQAFGLLSARFDIKYSFVNENPKEVQKRSILGYKLQEIRKIESRLVRKFGTKGSYTLINGTWCWLPHKFRQPDLLSVPVEKEYFNHASNC